jgi:hypothetical protein
MPFCAGTEDPFFLELLLNDVELDGLLDAARSLEGVLFFHGGKQQMTSFRPPATWAMRGRRSACSN